MLHPSDVPASGDTREPELYATNDGRIILSWIEKVGEKRHALRMATRDKTGWTQTMTVAAGDNWFVNWADFPSVIGLSNGSLAAHWLVKSGSSAYAYDVNIALSNDGGKTWSRPIVPHFDHTKTEHGFVSLVPLTNGSVGAIWLDGRNMKGLKDEHEGNGPLPVSMTLRYAVIDGNGNVSESAQLDDRVCECCQTSAALTSDGVIAVYRDRSETEVRDTYSVRYNGNAWTAPQPIFADNWQINGCPVNGPSVSAEGKDVVVGWYTGAGGTPQVKAAFSSDAGATFGSPIEVDEGETQGRIDVLLLPDKSALVCWLSGTPEGGQIKVRLIRPDGSRGPAAEIAKTDISRSSGFPRMARLGNEVHFAWTEFGTPSHIRMATADLGIFK